LNLRLNSLVHIFILKCKFFILNFGVFFDEIISLFARTTVLFRKTWLFDNHILQTLIQILILRSLEGLNGLVNLNPVSEWNIERLHVVHIQL